VLLALPVIHAAPANDVQRRQATGSASMMASSTTAVSTAEASAATPSARQSLQPAPKKQPTCESDLYCPGPLLQAVQLAGLYPDSKTFVDKPGRYPTEQILAYVVLFQDSNKLLTA